MMTGREGNNTCPMSTRSLTMNRILLTIGAILTLFLAAFHFTFPWFFQWGTGLSSLSNVNKAIFITAHVWIILILVLFASASIMAWRDLLLTRLGCILLLSIGLLWIMRAFTEVAYFRPGVDGAWWRVALFTAMAMIYWVPFLNTWYNTSQVSNTRSAIHLS